MCACGRARMLRGVPSSALKEQLMKRLSLPRLRVAAALALAMLASLVLVGPAAAAGKKKAEKPWNNPNKAVAYEGTTASGHEITFTFKKNRLYDMESGIAVS